MDLPLFFYQDQRLEQNYILPYQAKNPFIIFFSYFCPIRARDPFFFTNYA